MLKKLRYAVLCFYLYYFIPIHYCDKDLDSYRIETIQIIQQYCSSDQYNNPFHQYIYFKKLKDADIGECIAKFNTYKILIDPVFWKNANENERFQVYIHEVGHCLLGKNHVDNKFNYMYYMDNHLSKEVVKKQFIEDLRSKCGK